MHIYLFLLSKVESLSPGTEDCFECKTVGVLFSSQIDQLPVHKTIYFDKYILGKEEFTIFICILFEYSKLISSKDTLIH